MRKVAPSDRGLEVLVDIVLPMVKAMVVDMVDAMVVLVECTIYSLLVETKIVVCTYCWCQV